MGTENTIQQLVKGIGAGRLDSGYIYLAGDFFFYFFFAYKD